MRTFKDFKTEVRHIAEVSDYAENKHKLEDVKTFQYETFSYLIKCGVNITDTMIICVQISKISKETILTEYDILDLLPKIKDIILIMNK